MLSFGCHNNINYTLERERERERESFFRSIYFSYTYINSTKTAACSRLPFFACQQPKEHIKHDNLAEIPEKIAAISGSEFTCLF